MDSTENSWRRFEKSGKLSDYLNFCEERRLAAARKSSDTGSELKPGESLERDQSSI